LLDMTFFKYAEYLILSSVHKPFNVQD